MTNTLFFGNHEPSIDEMLADPIVHQVMRRDGIAADEVIATIDRIRTNLRARQDTADRVYVAA